MPSTRRFFRLTAAIATGVLLLSLAACGDDASDADLADHFKGKPVTIIVGSSPGGGFDTYARLVARHMGKYIPGQPNVIVENMPGAGHLIAMNHVYNNASKDGTVIGNVEGALSMRQLLGAQGVEFDFRDLTMLGAPDPPINDVLIVRKEAGVTDFADLLDDKTGAKLIVGVQEPGSLQTDGPLLLKNLLGANLVLVPGYEGTSDFVLAMEQGEIDAFWTTLTTIRNSAPEHFESGDWIPILGMVEDDDPDLADVPIIRDFAKTEEQRAVAEAVVPTWQYLRVYFLPPGVPDNVAAALQDAYRQALEDEDLLEEAARAELQIEHVPPEKLEEVFAKFLDMPEELKATVGEVLTLQR